MDHVFTETAGEPTKFNPVSRVIFSTWLDFTGHNGDVRFSHAPSPPFYPTTQVIENKFLGVPGGWSVDLMVVMNAPIKEWENQLPKDTKALLKQSREGKSPI